MGYQIQLTYRKEFGRTLIHIIHSELRSNGRHIGTKAQRDKVKDRFIHYSCLSVFVAKT